MKIITNHLVKSTLLCLVFLTGFSIELNAQGNFDGAPPSSQGYIQSVFDNEGNFIQHSIAVYPPSSEESVSYIIAGTLYRSRNDSDILVLRIDNTGNILWSKYLNYGQDEFVGSVKVVAHGILF